jgi:hypothetical protein
MPLSASPRERPVRAIQLCLLRCFSSPVAIPSKSPRQASVLTALGSARTDGFPLESCGAAGHLSFLLRASVRRHRSSLGRSIRRALTRRFEHLPTGAGRCQRPSCVPRFGGSWTETPPEKRSRLNRHFVPAGGLYVGYGCRAQRPYPYRSTRPPPARRTRRRAGPLGHRVSKRPRASLRLPERPACKSIRSSSSSCVAYINDERVQLAGEATVDVIRADSAEGGVTQMAKLESIGRRGTPGRPGDPSRGIPPQPPVPPQPPKPPKIMTPTGKVQGRTKNRVVRKRDDQGGADGSRPEGSAEGT